MELKTDYRGKDLSGQRFYKTDFSFQDLTHAKMRRGLFNNCIFDNADMTEANCEGSEFLGSTFRDTVMYRTNCKDAKLAGTVFEPKDAFGLTLTMSCKTFSKMRIKPTWWYSYLMYAMLMCPGGEEDTKILHTALMQTIGEQRYLRLHALFAKREV